MVEYPVVLPRNGYRGNDPRRKIRAAKENAAIADLERAINETLLKQEKPIQVYMHQYFCDATGLPVDQIRRFAFPLDCGHNGFTAIRKGLTYAQAVEELNGCKD